MDTNHEALINEAIKAEEHLILAFQAVSLPCWLELDISIAQLKGLMTLASIGNTTIRHFAEVLGISQSAASLLVDRLVQGDFVERTEDVKDRRRMVIRLNSRGEALTTQLHRGRSKHVHLRSWLNKMSE